MKWFFKKTPKTPEPLPEKGSFVVIDVSQIRIGDNVKALGTVTDKTFLPFSKVYQVWCGNKMYLIDKGTQVYREVF